MSKTSAPRTPLSTQRGRGRGNAQSTYSSQQRSANSTQTGTRGGVNVRTRRGSDHSTSVRGSRGQTYTQLNSTGRPRQMSEPQPTAGQPDSNDQNQPTNSASGFTVTSPDEKKRQKILQQAREEEAAYEAHVKQKTTASYNYVGTVGGQALSETEVRQKQLQAQRGAKLTNLEKQKHWRDEAKRREQEEIDKKLAKARSQVERNEQRKRQQQHETEIKWDQERRRTNDKFLSSLESRPPGYETASDTSQTTGASIMTRRRTGEEGATGRSYREEGATGRSYREEDATGRSYREDGATGRSYREEGATGRSYREESGNYQRENEMNESREIRATKQTDSQLAGQRSYSHQKNYKPQREVVRQEFNKMNLESSESESESDPMLIYSPLQMSVVYTLQDMFPQYALADLINICEQTGFSLEKSADLLA